jgi:nicotinate phosphoribosyltransferase
VGTRLITSRGQAALDGVYKLVAVQDGGEWVPAIKISETPAKVLNPGHKHAWRLYDRRGKANADLLGLDDEDPGQMERILLHHPTEHTTYRTLDQDDVSEVEPLLVDVLRDGERVYDPPSIEDMRQRRRADLERLDPGVRRIMNPHIYHVSLTERLWNLKQALTESMT